MKNKKSILLVMAILSFSLSYSQHIKNREMIVDKNEEGTQIKGFINVAKVLGFYTLVFVVLGLVVTGAIAAINAINF